MTAELPRWISHFSLPAQLQNVQVELGGHVIDFLLLLQVLPVLPVGSERSRQEEVSVEEHVFQVFQVVVVVGVRVRSRGCCGRGGRRKFDCCQVVILFLLSGRQIDDIWCILKRCFNVTNCGW